MKKLKTYLLTGLTLFGTLNCTPFEMTPGGISIYRGEYDVDLELLDRKYEETMNCVEENNFPVINNKNNVLVRIVSDENGWECFEGTKICHGRYLPELKEIYLASDLGAGAHESAHQITEVYTHDKKSPARVCGDRIDTRINAD